MSRSAIQYVTTASGSSSSGSSHNSSSSRTVKNDDGSTTSTKTDTDTTTGAVTVTTAFSDGSKTITVTQKDGSKSESVTKANGTKAQVDTDASGKVSATVNLPAGSGGTAVLPVGSLPIGKSTLAIHTNQAVTIVVPVEYATPGTVAVLVNPDGTEEIVKKSVLNKDGLAVPLQGNATLKIVDNSKSFKDVPANNWASDAISFVASRKLFEGTGSDSFAPALSMNRSMLVTVLYRIENEPANTGSVSFSDVADNTWYTDAAFWAGSNHIVQGNGSGFDPDGEITRQELVTMLYRYANTQGENTGGTGDLTAFTDGDSVASWASVPMKWAVGNGILSGKNNGALDPEGNATRAEVAAILSRYMEMMTE